MMKPEALGAILVVIVEGLLIGKRRGFNIKPISRVIGGTAVYEEKYEFVVSIAWVLTVNKEVVFIRDCTGSVIAPNWVLTAGHCANQQGIDPYVILSGDITLYPNVTNRYKKVVAFYRHPRYTYGTYIRSRLLRLDNDLQLLKTEAETMSPGKITAIDYLSLFGRKLRHIGVGANYSDAEMNNITAREDLVNIFQKLPRQYFDGIAVKCDESNPGMGRKVICLVHSCKSMQRVQRGDSGGPLLFKDKIVGVASFFTMGDGAGTSHFAAVSPYMDWILDVITKHSVNFKDNKTVKANKTMKTLT